MLAGGTQEIVADFAASSFTSENPCGTPGTVFAIVTDPVRCRQPGADCVDGLDRQREGRPGVRLRNVCERVVEATVVDQAVLPLPADLSTR